MVKTSLKHLSYFAQFKSLFWQVYTEKLYKKDLNDPDNHDPVITYLEPDIVVYEIKWA